MQVIQLLHATLQLSTVVLFQVVYLLHVTMVHNFCTAVSTSVDAVRHSRWRLSTPVVQTARCVQPRPCFRTQSGSHCLNIECCLCDPSTLHTTYNCPTFSSTSWDNSITSQKLVCLWVCLCVCVSVSTRVAPKRCCHQVNGINTLYSCAASSHGCLILGPVATKHIVICFYIQESHWPIAGSAKKKI